MTVKSKHASPATTGLAPVVLFGIDSTGKPKAARFGKDHASLASKAASQLQLRVLAGNDPKVAEIAARLPVGRIHATGRAFVPFVHRDLYDKLVAIAPNGNGHPPSNPPSNAVGGGAAGSRPPDSKPNLPRSWREIGLGDLVVAQEGVEEGWFEAIVAETDGDMLTLRWRDYPRERRVTRHRNRVGLLYPNGKPATENGAAAKSPASKKQETAATQAAGQHALPANWQEIDVGHLVLAKDDGPWLAWWEAVAAEKAGDIFKLRWRDYSHVPLITRPRLALALICPDPA